MLQDQLERDNLRLRSENDALSRLLQATKAKEQEQLEPLEKTIARYRFLLLLTISGLLFLSVLLIALP
jgi:hypothetical protein